MDEGIEAGREPFIAIVEPDLFAEGDQGGEAVGRQGLQERAEREPDGEVVDQAEGAGSHRRPPGFVVTAAFGDGAAGSAATIPEVEEENQPGEAGQHEDPADHLQIQPGDRRVYREGQDRAHGDKKDTYSDTHTGSVPSAERSISDRLASVSATAGLPAGVRRRRNAGSRAGDAAAPAAPGRKYRAGGPSGPAGRAGTSATVRKNDRKNRADRHWCIPRLVLVVAVPLAPDPAMAVLQRIVRGNVGERADAAPFQASRAGRWTNPGTGGRRMGRLTVNGDGSGTPRIIQGGMGVAISGWRLARAVARTGQLGVVSGTALEVVCARRLQEGDPGGDVRRALAHFPLPGTAERILRTYYIAGGKAPQAAYRPVLRFTLHAAKALQELSALGSINAVLLYMIFGDVVWPVGGFPLGRTFRGTDRCCVCRGPGGAG